MKPLHTAPSTPVAPVLLGLLIDHSLPWRLQIQACVRGHPEVKKKGWIQEISNSVATLRVLQENARWKQTRQSSFGNKQAQRMTRQHVAMNARLDSGLWLHLLSEC